MGEWLVDLATFAARFGCFGWAEAGGWRGRGEPSTKKIHLQPVFVGINSIGRYR